MNKNDLKKMRTRAVSGAVYVALIAGSLLLAPVWFSTVMAIFAVLAVIELEKLLGQRATITPAVRLCDALMAVCLVVISYDLNFIYPVLLYFPVRIILAVSDRSEAPARSVLYSFLAVFYAALPLAMLACANVLAHMGSSLFGYTNVVLITFIMIWLNDTGAYLTGMSFGRHKMCERLSPKKTWEGFWGGFCFCVLAGVAASLWFSQTGSMVQWILYGAAVSVLGTYGDLFESLIKRTLGVKDSGNLIPGHGGILDRIDSILAVAPLALIFVMMI